MEKLTRKPRIGERVRFQSPHYPQWIADYTVTGFSDSSPDNIARIQGDDGRETTIIYFFASERGFNRCLYFIEA